MRSWRRILTRKWRAEGFSVEGHGTDLKREKVGSGWTTSMTLSSSLLPCESSKTFTCKSTARFRCTGRGILAEEVGGSWWRAWLSPLGNRPSAKIITARIRPPPSNSSKTCSWSCFTVNWTRSSTISATVEFSAWWRMCSSSAKRFCLRIINLRIASSSAWVACSSLIRSSDVNSKSLDR